MFRVFPQPVKPVLLENLGLAADLDCEANLSVNLRIQERL